MFHSLAHAVAHAATIVALTTPQPTPLPPRLGIPKPIHEPTDVKPVPVPPTTVTTHR